ncbi:MAG: efflux RND transporter periplasmic adaptor subunit [Rhodanobacteraceae bacterium]
MTNEKQDKPKSSAPGDQERRDADSSRNAHNDTARLREDENRSGSGSDSDANNGDERSNGNKKNALRGKRKPLLIGLACLFVIAGVVWLLVWIFVFSQRATTDDAQVGGNQVMVSAQVPGTVIEVRTDDTRLVRAGNVLVRLDPTDAEVNLAKAKSALAQAVRQVRQQSGNAAAADAQVASGRLRLHKALADLQRRTPLKTVDAIAPEELAHARDAVASARAALETAQRNARAAHASVDGTSIARNPAVMQARAQFREAWINSQRDAIVAPVSGYVAQRSVQVGQRVQPGQPLLTVIALDNLWIDANFKESDLAHVRIGQPAEIETDLYGDDVTFRGHVSGLSPGTGSAFALLPPQNASGNWIKVVQRVPVRIAIDAKQLHDHPLRVGLSASVTIDTHDRSGHVLAQNENNPPVTYTSVYRNDYRGADAQADAIIRANLGDAAPDTAAR